MGQVVAWGEGESKWLRGAKQVSGRDLTRVARAASEDDDIHYDDIVNGVVWAVYVPEGLDEGLLMKDDAVRGLMELPPVTRVTIELEIEGEPDGAYVAVDSILDNGVLQDEVNACEETALHVLSATCRLTDVPDRTNAIAALGARLTPFRQKYIKVPDLMDSMTNEQKARRKKEIREGAIRMKLDPGLLPILEELGALGATVDEEGWVRS